MTYVIDRGIVKAYFKGTTGPVAVIVIGVATAVLTYGIIFAAGIIWLVIEKYRVNKDAETTIDSLIGVETQRLKERGMKRLNITDGQVNIIEPICLYGSSSGSNPAASDNKGMIAKFFKRVSSAFEKGDEPVWLSKVGSDGIWRYSLLELNILLFDEEQMFIYYASLDLTTGLVFQEGTYEYLYRDILSINLDQKQIKTFNPKKKKFERKLVENLTVYTAGFSHKASYDTNINPSHIDSQLAAMRNLIRDKKTSKTPIEAT